MEQVAQGLALETETICSQYKGVLMRNTYVHAKLKAHELELSELLRQNTQIQGLGKSPCLVLYNKRRPYIIKDQLLLHKAAVPPESDLICLALFDTKRERLDFKSYYLMQRAAWDKLTLVQSHYKPVNLQYLVSVDLLSKGEEEEEENMMVESAASSLSFSLTSSTSTLTEDEGDGEEVQPMPVLTELRPFWLHELMHVEDRRREATNDDALRQYIQLVLDMVIWRRYYHNNPPLKRKGLLYYARHVGDHHGELALLFISQMVEHSGHDVTRRVHSGRKDCKEEDAWFIDQASTRLYKEWLATEMALFRECRWYAVLEEQMASLRDHAALLRRCMPLSLWPTWLSYTVDGEQEEVYWLQLSDSNYVVKAEWLLKPAFESLLCSLPIERGYALLSPQLFQTVFLPLLYECVLDDVRVYLFYVYYGEDPSTNVARDTLRQLRDAYHYTWQDTQRMDQVIQKCSLYKAASLFDLAAEVGDISSPVVRKMVKTRPEFDLSRTEEEINASAKWYERHMRREDVPDIEDLANKKIAPPCMRQIFAKDQRPHMGFHDRLNVVMYLIDLAYTKEEVVEFLCRGHQQDRHGYVQLISSVYDSLLKDKRSNKRDLHHTQHHSFNCGALINVVPQNKDKSHLRCPFAVAYEEKHKTHRRKYEADERKVFQLSCGATMDRPKPWGTTSHPIEYTLSQLRLS